MSLNTDLLGIEIYFFLFSFYMVIIMPRGAGLVGLPGLTQVIYIYIYIDFFLRFCSLRIEFYNLI